MTRAELEQQIKEKQSMLCVGLDTDISKIPTYFLNEPDPVFAFNKTIIDATLPYAVSYKINTAFYEANGVKGWHSLEKTANYLPKNVFKIADAKRGDIGNTSAQYAKAFFEQMPFDAVTVSPYMGKDSILPFYGYEGKWVIVLALTSNTGAADFELQKINDQYLFEHVMQSVKNWGNNNNTMFVIGATQTQHLDLIKKQAEDFFMLVPGVGAQGGSLADIMSLKIPALINVSRAIIYATEKGEDLAKEASAIASQYQYEMKQLM
jgi:orotidine-5'-phosphate decarboxylase